VSGAGGAGGGSGGGSAAGAGHPASTATGGGGGVAYCDCNNVDAGLLTREYQNQCRARETQLKQLASSCGSKMGEDLDCTISSLKLKTGPDGKLVSGEFCDSVSSGPAAWPVGGGPMTPPPRGPEKKPCTKVSGLSRTCD
jgi:hypothetical protein